MDTAITVGNVITFVLIVGGIVGVAGFLLWVLSVIASSFNH